MEKAFLGHGPPKHIITDQEGVFVSDAFAELLTRWDVNPRFGFPRCKASQAVPGTAPRSFKEIAGTAATITGAGCEHAAFARCWRRSAAPMAVVWARRDGW
jgi:hypothetical protein